MYKLSKEAIQEFQNLYKQSYGKELDETEAEKVAIKLTRLYELILEKPSDNLS